MGGVRRDPSYALYQCHSCVSFNLATGSPLRTPPLTRLASLPLPGHTHHSRNGTTLVEEWVLAVVGGLAQVAPVRHN